MIDYFNIEKVNDKITAIRSRSGEIMYLVEGEKKAVLIDTCVGVKGLCDVIKKITDKPVTVLLTHGHMDHAMGAAEFEEVFMNLADLKLYREQSCLKDRKNYIEISIGRKEDWMNDDNNFVLETVNQFHELRDGDRFELGGISVEAYSLGGHTAGTMVMLIPEKRILITGDACNNATFLFAPESLSVEEYKRNLQHVDKRLNGKYDECFMMHHVIKASGALLKNVISLCDEILCGHVDDMPYEFMGQINYVAKKADNQFIRADGGEGNIIYSKQKILETR